MCEYFLASTIPHMVWLARIEEIERENLKENILVRFWSPLFFFVLFYILKSMWLQEAVTVTVGQ